MTQLAYKLTFPPARLHFHDSKCTCHLNVNAAVRPRMKADRIDPTRTLSIRRAFEAEIVRRFRKLMELIDRAIVELDVLGLEPLGQHTELNTNAMLPSRAFAFRRSDEKVAGFMNWFHGQVNEGVLGQKVGDPRKAVGNAAWANVYIDSSYKQGMARAEGELRRAGITPSGIPTGARLSVDAMFNLPIHADRVGLIYTRTYSELKGVTDSMEQTMSKVLAQGIADGKGPRQIARELKNRIEQAGGDLAIVSSRGTPIRAVDRARMIARTETIRAHNVANINVYREAQLEGVVVQSEWLGTLDDRMCPDCASLNGKVFALSVIEAMIPLHPNCRCAAIPYLGDPAKQGLKQVEDGVWETPKAPPIADEVLPSIPVPLPETVPAPIDVIPKAKVTAVYEPLPPPPPPPPPAAPVRAPVNPARVPEASPVPTNPARLPVAPTPILEVPVQPAPVPIPLPVEPPAWQKVSSFDDLRKPETREAFNRMGFAYVDVPGKPTMQALKWIDRSAEHLDGVTRRCPKINKIMADSFSKRLQRRASLNLVNTDNLGVGKNGGIVLGRWSSSERKLEIAARRAWGVDPKTTIGRWHAAPGQQGSLRHEYGHMVFKSNAPEARIEWNNLVNEKLVKPSDAGIGHVYTDSYGRPIISDLQRKKVISKLISEYGATDASEAHAEAFACWTSPRYGEAGAKRLPKIVEEYMDKWYGKAGGAG